jgi:hypothetical protein
MIRDIPEIRGPEDIDTINMLINQFNLLARGLSLGENFDGQIIEVTIPAGEEKVIPHKLGVLPRYRIILRQVGNGVISDTPSGWNNFQIQLRNNGAVSVTATILLVRE